MSAGRLESKVALVTGGASGIGKACATKFASEGARVMIADMNLSGAHDAASAINAGGGDCAAVELDVTVADSCAAAVDATLGEYGQVDVLVNSAGIWGRADSPETSYEERWDKVIGVNLKGTVLMARAVVEYMKQQGGGSIVNVASIRGLVGYPDFITDGFNPYPHSKGGVVNFTRDLANGVAKSGVRVNALCPGFTDTDMTRSTRANPEVHQKIVDLHPIGRFATPDEIANGALFLASDEASFVTGACLVMDGGFTAQ